MLPTSVEASCQTISPPSIDGHVRVNDIWSDVQRYLGEILVLYHFA